MTKPRPLVAFFSWTRDQYKAWGGALGFFSSNCRAMASYAKQADDDSLRKHADRIQARAVRRAQELLRQFPVGKGGDRKSDQSEGTHGLVSRSKAATDAGMSPHQYRTAMDVGHVPVDKSRSESGS